MPSAKLLVFDHAIYIHLGDQFAVKRLDLENRRCFVEEADTDYWTDSIVKTDIKVLWRRTRSGTAAGIRAVLGDILVRTQATKFKKLKYHTNENIGYGDITLPADEMHTRSAVLLFDETTAPRKRFCSLSHTEQRDRDPATRRSSSYRGAGVPPLRLRGTSGCPSACGTRTSRRPASSSTTSTPAGIGLAEGFLENLPRSPAARGKSCRTAPARTGVPPASARRMNKAQPTPRPRCADSSARGPIHWSRMNLPECLGARSGRADADEGRQSRRGRAGESTT